MIDAVSTYTKALAKFPAFEYDVSPRPPGAKAGRDDGRLEHQPCTRRPRTQALAWDMIDYITREKHSQWITDSGYYASAWSGWGRSQRYSTFPWTLSFEQIGEVRRCVRPPTPGVRVLPRTSIGTKATEDIAKGAPVPATSTSRPL